MLTSKNVPLVSIIIVNFNGEGYLNNCLSSVLGISYPKFEVVLVDNGSTDQSIEAAKTAFGNDKRLKIVKSAQNMGFSAGNNLGFAHTKGQYIVFLNSDTTVNEQWLDFLVNSMEADSTIGLAQSAILSIDGKKVGDAGWLWSDYLLFLHPIGREKKGNFEFIPIFEVSFASGCSMITSRALLDKIGLFDARIPFNYDDVLMSFKTWLSGKRVVTVSASKVYHIGGAATAKYLNSHTVKFSNSRAKLLLIFDLYYKRLDLLKALFNLFFSVVFDCVDLILKQQIKAFQANIRALLWILRNFKYVWSNRLDHWKNACVSPDCLLEKMIRLHVSFPLDIIPSITSYERRRIEIHHYEKKVSLNKELKQTIATVKL